MHLFAEMIKEPQTTHQFTCMSGGFYLGTHAHLIFFSWLTNHQALAPLSTPLLLPQTTAWLTTCQTRESATLTSGHLWGANLIPKDSIIKVSSELTLRHHTNYDKRI